METTSVKSRLASIVSFVSGKDKPTVNVSAIELRNLTEQSFESPESPPVTPTIPDPVLEHAYKRIDRRLLAWYVITFAIVGMASHNIVNSAIMNKASGGGIKVELGHLSDEQWALIISSMAYPMLALEPFSTLMLKRFTPRVWIGRIMVTWGILAMCTAASQGFGSLFGIRFALGVMEAGFLPCIFYHMSFWYPAERLTVRVSLVAGLRAFVGCFSGLLAFAIAHLNNATGLSGWRWLFLLEGIPALLAGVFTVIWLPNYPETCSFLTAAERAAVVANRPKRQPKASDSAWDWKAVKDLFKRPSTYTFTLILICNALGAKGIGTVFPTVILALGITDSTNTQLMGIPNAVIGGCVLLTFAWLIQKKKLPSWYTCMVLEFLAGCCYVGLIWLQHPVGRYLIIVLANTLVTPVFSLLIPERLASVQGASATAMAIGITTAAPHLHGIIGPHIWLDRFGPTYTTSIAVSIGIIAAGVLLIPLTKWLMKREGYSPVIARQRPEIFGRAATVEDQA